jgi:hypothetical protein
MSRPLPPLFDGIPLPLRDVLSAPNGAVNMTLAASAAFPSLRFHVVGSTAPLPSMQLPLFDGLSTIANGSFGLGHWEILQNIFDAAGLVPSVLGLDLRPLTASDAPPAGNGGAGCDAAGNGFAASGAGSAAAAVVPATSSLRLGALHDGYDAASVVWSQPYFYTDGSEAAVASNAAEAHAFPVYYLSACGVDLLGPVLSNYWYAEASDCGP